MNLIYDKSIIDIPKNDFSTDKYRISKIRSKIEMDEKRYGRSYAKQIGIFLL
jgi:hypothetical protein